MAGEDCKIKCSLEHFNLSDLQCNLVCDQDAQGAIASHGADTAPGAVSEFVQVALSLLGITYGSALGRGVLRLFGSSEVTEAESQDVQSWSADLMGNVGISSLSSMPSASLLAELGVLSMLLATPAAIFRLWKRPSPEQEADERIRQRGVEKMYSIIHMDKTISSLGLRGYEQLSRTDRIDRLSTLETEVDLGIAGMDIIVTKRNGKIKISYKGSSPTTLKEADLLSEDRARHDKAIQKLIKAKWFQEKLSAFERNKIVLALKKGDFEAVELAAKGISVTVVRPRPKVVIENKTIQEGVRQMVEEGKPLQVMTRLEEQKNDEPKIDAARMALVNQRRIISSAMQRMAEAKSLIQQRPEISELSKAKGGSLTPMDILSEMVLARYKLSSDADQEAVSKRYGTNGHEVPIDWVRDLLKTDALLHDDIIGIEKLQPLIPYHGQLKGMESYDVLSFNAKLRLLSTIERRYKAGGLSEKNHMMQYKLGSMESVKRFLEGNPQGYDVDLANNIVALWELMTEDERVGVKKRFRGAEFKAPSDWAVGKPDDHSTTDAFSKAIGTSDDLKYAVAEMKTIPEGWIEHVLNHPEEYLPDKRVINVASMIIIDEQLRSMGWNSDGLSPREHLEKLNEIVERALKGRVKNLVSTIVEDEQLRSMRWSSDGLTDRERQVRLEEIIRRATGHQVKGMATAQEIDEQIRSMGWDSDDLSQSDNLSELRKIVKHAIGGRAKDLASMIVEDKKLMSMEWNSDDLTDDERQDRLKGIIEGSTRGRVKDESIVQEIDKQIRSIEWDSEDLNQPDNLSELGKIVERALKKRVEKSPSMIIEGILKKSTKLSSDDLTQIIKDATVEWVKAEVIARKIDMQIRSEGWGADDLIQPDNLSKLKIIVERALEKQVKDLSSKIVEDKQLRSMKWSSDPSTDGERRLRLRIIIESATGDRVKGESIVQEIDEQIRSEGWDADDLKQPDNLSKLMEIVKRPIEEELVSKIVEDGQLRSMRWSSDGITDSERQLRLRKIIERATGGYVKGELIVREIDKQIRSMKWNADNLRQRDNLSKLMEIVESEIESSVLYRRWCSVRSGYWNILFEVDPHEYALRQRTVEVDFNTWAMSKEIKALRARYDAIYSKVAQMPDVLEKASEHGMDAHGVTRIILMYEHFFATEVKPEWVRPLVESPTFRVLDPLTAEEAARAKAAEQATMELEKAHSLFAFGIADTEIAGEQGVNEEAAAARQAEAEESDVFIEVEDDEDDRETIPAPEPEEVRKDSAVAVDAQRADDAQEVDVEPAVDFEDDEDNRKTIPILEVPEEVRKGFIDAMDAQRVDDAQKAEAPPSVERPQAEPKPAEKPAEMPRVGDTLPTGVVPTPEQLDRARQGAEPSGEAFESKPLSTPPVSLPPPKSPPRRRAAVAKPPLPPARPSRPVSLPPPTPTSFPKRPAVLTIPSLPAIRGVAESGAPSSPTMFQLPVESAPAADSGMGSLITEPPKSKPQKKSIVSRVGSWLFGPKGGEALLEEAMQRDMAADEGMPRPRRGVTPPPLPPTPPAPPVVEQAAQARPKPPPLPPSPPVVEQVAQARPKAPPPPPPPPPPPAVERTAQSPLPPPPPPPVAKRAAELPLPPPPPPPVVEPASVIEPPSTSHVRVKATGRRLPSTPPVLRKASVPPPPPPVVSQRRPTVDELIAAEMSRVDNDVPSGVRTRYVPPQPARSVASGIPPPVLPHHTGFLADDDKLTLEQLIEGSRRDVLEGGEECQARQKAQAEQRKGPRIPTSKPRLLPPELPSTPPRLSSPKLPSTPPRLSMPKLPSTPPRLRPIDGAGSAAQSGRPLSKGEANAHISEGEARRPMSAGEARAHEKASEESRRERTRRARRVSHK